MRRCPATAGAGGSSRAASAPSRTCRLPTPGACRDGPGWVSTPVRSRTCSCVTSAICAASSPTARRGRGGQQQQRFQSPASWPPDAASGFPGPAAGWRRRGRRDTARPTHVFLSLISGPPLTPASRDARKHHTASRGRATLKSAGKPPPTATRANGTAPPSAPCCPRPRHGPANAADQEG